MVQGATAFESFYGKQIEKEFFYHRVHWSYLIYRAKPEVSEDQERSRRKS